MSVLDEVRMILETQVLAVFQHEKSVGLQQSVSEDEVGNLRKFFQCIRRVGEDEVELFLTFLDVFEYVTFQGEAFVCFHFIHDFPYECVMLRVLFYGYDPVASP